MVTHYIKTLFNYAHKSIEAGFSDSEFRPEKVPKELMKKQGVFVTLTINGRLRGCIGLVKPTPLWKGVIEAARSSAFDDYRFMPLSQDEYKQVLIEISILTKPVKTTRQAIKKGDGVIIKKGHYSALFLPQVWNELPNKEEFLKQLFIKAGLKTSEQGINYLKFKVKAWKEKSLNLIKPVNP